MVQVLQAGCWKCNACRLRLVLNALSHALGEGDGRPKVRPIDDYKASQVNACVTQTEQVTIHNMDVVAGTIAYWLKCAKGASVDSSVLAKCWDLKSAYKQLPLEDTSRELDGHFVISSPSANSPWLDRKRDGIHKIGYALVGHCHFPACACLDHVLR